MKDLEKLTREELIELVKELSIDWTGAYNRNYKIDLEEYEIVYIDLNDLKEFNDRLGHLEGDVYIQYTVNLIKAHLHPEKDILIRWGGDEFVVISDIAYNLCNTLNIYPELSCGYGKGKTIEEAIVQADSMMYKNKKSKKLRYSKED